MLVIVACEGHAYAYGRVAYVQELAGRAALPPKLNRCTFESYFSRGALVPKLTESVSTWASNSRHTTLCDVSPADCGSHGAARVLSLATAYGGTPRSGLHLLRDRRLSSPIAPVFNEACALRGL